MIGLSPSWSRAETDPPPEKTAGLAEVVNFYPLAGTQLEIIKSNKINLQRDYRQARIEWAVESDSLRITLDMLGRQLEVALDNRAKWYQDTRLWFLIGAASGILVVAETLKLSF